MQLAGVSIGARPEASQLFGIDVRRGQLVIRAREAALGSSARTVALLVSGWELEDEVARPTSASRPLTTSRAAAFSATKRTRLPCARHSAITLVTVWDFPVPGGPSMTALAPSRAATMATCWLESASIT